VTEPQRALDTSRRHYSYEHYRDPAVAAGFDELRFGGPIGQYLLRVQERQVLDALSPLAGRTVLDVGVGTGRVAIGLATAGADVLGLDASPEMLREARSRIASAGRRARLGVADAHRLPVDDRSVDAAVCFRVLMHAVNWQQCVAELCRVSRWRVMVDFPARSSLAAIESGVRRARHALGGQVEAYRVMSQHEVRDVFERHGFRIVDVRRQFVLPIAFHKAIGRLGFTESTERALETLGLLRLFGSPVTMVAER